METTTFDGIARNLGGGIERRDLRIELGELATHADSLRTLSWKYPGDLFLIRISHRRASWSLEVRGRTPAPR